MGIFKKIFSRLSEASNYKGIVNAQIDIYKKAKKWKPERSENDVLNWLITSRIKSFPKVASEEEQKSYYKTLLLNVNKTLEETIWSIVDYEYFKMGSLDYKPEAHPWIQEEEKEEARQYVKDAIKELNK